VRTSVDHGTALDLAGTGRIDTGSLQVALETATRWPARAEPRLARRRRMSLMHPPGAPESVGERADRLQRHRLSLL